MLPLFSGIVLDVILIVLLLTIVAVGAFKGILHTAINYLLLLASAVLSFMPFTNILKNSLISLISPIVKIGAGVSSEHKLGIYFTYTLIASILLTILFYAILRILKYGITILILKKKQRNTRAAKSVSRVFGALFSLIFNGIFLLVLLSVFSTKIVGGDKIVEATYVTKHVDKMNDKLFHAVGDKSKEKLMLILFQSNLLLETSEDDIYNFNNISQIVSEENFIPKDLDGVQVTLDRLHSLLSYVVAYGLNENGVEVDGYELIVEESRNLVAKSINAMSNLHGENEPIEANKTLAITKLLEKIGLPDSKPLIEKTFVIQ